MFLVGVLIFLGLVCLFVGWIVFIVGGFRESVAWGMILLFLPILVALVGYFLGLLQSNWWWMVNLGAHLPWLVFLFMCWEKAKSGFLLGVAGIIFFAAAFFNFANDSKAGLEAFIVARTGQPLPPALAEWLGAKPGASGAKGANPAATAGKVDPNAPPAKPGTATADPASAPPAAAAAPVASIALDTEAQVQAALAELNDRARKLMARKEALKNTNDQPAVFALAEDIKAFNERLKLVTARQAELAKGKSPAATASPAASSAAPGATPAAPAPPPAPSPTASGPVIPSTVVIPASTPVATPVPKKK